MNFGSFILFLDKLMHYMSSFFLENIFEERILQIFTSKVTIFKISRNKACQKVCLGAKYHLFHLLHMIFVLKNVTTLRKSTKCII